MAEEKKEKKGFFKEFKEFIARGNVLDMAVGIIIGGAFTAIVNALCNNILKPIINWILAAIFGAHSLTGVFTFLRKVVDAEGVVDLTQSIYIDWGTCINAVINFILTALVLFLIIKAVMKVSKLREEAKRRSKRRLKSARRKRLPKLPLPPLPPLPRQARRTRRAPLPPRRTRRLRPPKQNSVRKKRLFPAGQPFFCSARKGRGSPREKIFFPPSGEKCGKPCKRSCIFRGFVVK